MRDNGKVGCWSCHEGNRIETYLEEKIIELDNDSYKVGKGRGG